MQSPAQTAETTARPPKIIASVITDLPAPDMSRGENSGTKSRALIHLMMLEGGGAASEPSYAVGIPMPHGVAMKDVGRFDVESVSPERAVLGGLSALAMHHVRNSGVQIGDPVIVFGADPWALLLVQWTVLQGASPVVFASKSTQSLCELAAGLGVDSTLADPTPGDLARAVKMTHRGAGFAVALDGIASQRSMVQALSALRDGGKYVLAGMDPQQQVSLNAYPDLHRRDLEIVSAAHPAAEVNFAKLFGFSVRLATEGRLQLETLLANGSGWRVVKGERTEARL